MRRIKFGGPPSVRAAATLLALVALAVPGTALAQTMPEPTAMSVVAPSTAALGRPVSLQVRLADRSGAPVAGEKVLLSTQSTFLGASGNVVVAQATTNAEGLATADYEARSAGEQTLRVEFPGNERYAPSRTSVAITIGDAPRQLYAQHAGVRIPVLNAAPDLGPTMVSEALPLLPLAALSGLWPRLSGWPIAAALLVVWSLYAYVVTLMFRMAAAKPAGASSQFASVHVGSVTSAVGPDRASDHRN